MLNFHDVKNARPSEKPYKLFDKEGLYLLVKKNGSRLWRLKYRFDKKEKSLALGRYSEISLSEARTFRSEARSLLARNIDPCENRKAEKVARLIAVSGTFRAIAEVNSP